MIVNYTENGWEIITQRAHGVVAAQIGFQWRAKDRPHRWVETLLAIAEHDDAENELDGENLITPAGGPLNFDMKNFELTHCQKLSSLTITKSRYIALLTSMHMSFLYEKDRDSIAGAGAFLDEQKVMQDKWRKELNLSKEEAMRMYDLLEWCDALSLLLCKGEAQPEERKTDISTGPDKKMYQLVQVDETIFTVQPWPFEALNFEVSYDTRLISQMGFRTTAEFREAFVKAEVIEKRWKLIKQTNRPIKKTKV